MSREGCRGVHLCANVCANVYHSTLDFSDASQIWPWKAACYDSGYTQLTVLFPEL